VTESQSLTLAPIEESLSDEKAHDEEKSAT
jgi:hypothetical protein